MLRSGVHLFIDGVVVRRIGLILAALLLGTAGAGGAPPASAPASGPATTQAVPPRAPAPGEAERAKGLALVKSVFKDDWAKTAAADRVALARRLLAEAAATRDNPGARYVLFEQAGECAAAGGDAELAVKSMDGLARYFVVTPLEPKVRLLARTAPAVATPAGQEVLVEQCLALLPEAMREDRFDLAETLAGTAESAAVRSKKVALVDALGPRVAESRQLAAEYAVVAGALEKLKTAPEDPQENWSVGRYYCFAKGQWERGLPYLAKCSDAGIRDMAAREVAGVSDPQEQARLADAWWALAEKLTGPARTHTARHAVGWYQTAARGLEGITLAAIRQRIEAGQPGKAADTQPATQAAEGIDLLKLVDTTKDVVEGTWNLKDGVLSCASGRNVRVQLPYRAPDEYDLRVTFVRQAGSGPVALLLTARGEAFGLELDAKSHVARFEMINKKIAAENPSSVACTLENGTAYTVVVQVRREGVKATLDGKALTQWATDYKDMSRYSVWKLKDERLLGIGASSAEVVFRRVEVVEVKGEGKKIR